MQKHPDHRYFTASGPVRGEKPPFAVPALPKISSSENLSRPVQLFLNALRQESALLREARCAVDLARAELTDCLAGTSAGLTNLAAERYKLAATRCRQLARQELRIGQEARLRQAEAGTPEDALHIRQAQEAAEDLLAALQDAEARGMLAGTAQEMLEELDRLDRRLSSEPCCSTPPPTLSGSTEVRGDLR